jgi:hypothetical protein
MQNPKSLLALCLLTLSSLVGCGMQLAEPADHSCTVCVGAAGAGSTGGSSSVDGGTPVADSSVTGGSTGTLSVDCGTKFPNGLTSPFRVENVAPDGTNDGTVSFSEQYLPAGSNGYAVGNLPGVGWTAAVLMTKSNGRFYYKIPITSDFVKGTYAAQYVSNPTVVNGNIPSQYYSPFGVSQEQVACYSADDKAFIYCNMKDGAINGCEFRGYVELVNGKVKITGAGNLPLVPAGQLF